MKTAMVFKTLTLALALVLIMVLAGCGPRLDWSLSSDGREMFLANTTISFSDLPVLDKVVQVRLTFNMRRDVNPVQNATIRLILPEGFELVSGRVEWEGDFINGESFTYETSIKAVQMGEWNMVAQAFRGALPDPDYLIGYVWVDAIVSERGVLMTGPRTHFWEIWR